MLPFIRIFDLRIPSYGLLMVLGIFAGCFFFGRLAKAHVPKSIDRQIIASFPVVAALVGAKLLFVLVSLPEYLKLARAGLWKALLDSLLHSGFVFYGGLLAALLCFYVCVKKLGYDFWSLSDCAAPALALGHAFGRLGCFAAGCCYGAVSESCGLAFTHSPAAPNGVPLLPVQLFEAAFNFALAGLLYYRQRRGKPGSATLAYLTLYAAWRFAIEFWRGDAQRGLWLGLSTSQWISLGLILLGALLYRSLRKRRGVAQEAAGVRD